MSDTDRANKVEHLSDYRYSPWLISLGLAVACAAIVWLVLSLLP